MAIEWNEQLVKDAMVTAWLQGNLCAKQDSQVTGADIADDVNELYELFVEAEESEQT
jgi:hypothetical protein